MSEKLIGVVKWAGGKDIKGRTYFSFNLVDIDGFFRCGTNDPKVSAGDTVSFAYEIDPKWGNQVDTKSIEVVDSAPTTTTKTPAAGGKAVGRDEYWANKEAADVDRQKIISLQAATNIATNIVTAALAAEVLALPAKKAEKFDALLAMVNTVADSLVVRYVNAPLHVDLLCAEEDATPPSANYGDDISDE